MNNDKAAEANPLQIVSSSRLQALRAKAEAANQIVETPPASNAKSQSKEDAETARLRQVVEAHLQRIMATMPSGKQHCLFKIRFGASLLHIQSLAPKDAAKLLKIKF